MKRVVRRKLCAIGFLVLVSLVILIRRHELVHFESQHTSSDNISGLENEEFNGGDSREKRLPHFESNALINTSGCQVPNMQAFSLTAMKHWRVPEPLQCSRRGRKYRVSRSINEKPGSKILLSPPPGMECCFRHIRRVSHNDNEVKYDRDCRPLARLLAPEEASDSDDKNPEFVRLSCHHPDEVDGYTNDEFRDLYAFIPIKEHVEYRCEHVPKQKDQLSVLILGIDSVSRLNMQRQMRQTYDLLTSPSIAATTFLGYNKVGDNTFPNLIPLLTGYSVQELDRACNWPGSNDWSHQFDSCPLIWNDFALNGYRTMYAEECPKLSTFNFQKGGFRSEPTDYYLRPYLLAASTEIAHTYADTCHLCLGARSSVSALLDYTTKFVRRFSSERYFAFSWATSLTHDGLNMAGLADKPYKTTVQGFLTRGDIEHTALVFISDHGVRTGDFRLTPQGRVEERLPFLSIAFPSWFRANYPIAMTNFVRNARERLTTPYDVHETLRDLMLPAEFMQDDAIQKRMQKMKASAVKIQKTIKCLRDLDWALRRQLPTSLEGVSDGTPNAVEGITGKSKTKNNIPRGTSLFLEIPEDRDCDNAGIPRHWCTCLHYQILPLNDTRVPDVAAALVEHINERYIKSHTHHGCQVLKLKNVLEARLGVASEQSRISLDSGISDFALTITTTPGDAIFEGAVRVYINTDRKRKGHQGPSPTVVVNYEVADTVSRLNRYGNQSDCVSDWVAKLYCYCGKD